MIYLTSDTHFNHDQEFVYKQRGYSCVEDMNDDLIYKWNSLIMPEDTVYHLGDIFLGDNCKGIEILNRLSGKINIVLGNHDTDARIELFQKCTNVESIQYATMIKCGKRHVYLSHYPSIVCGDPDIRKPHPLVCAYGHTHQKDKFYHNLPYIYNVGVDAHDGYPVEVSQMIKEMIQQRDKLVEEMHNGSN